MIFNLFQKFIKGRDSAEDYLSIGLEKSFSDLQQGLGFLTLKDNLDGFFVTLTLLSGETTKVLNRLSTIPTGFITLRQTGAGQLTEDANSPWTVTDLSVKNNGAVSVTSTLFFLR